MTMRPAAMRKNHQGVDIVDGVVATGQRQCFELKCGFLIGGVKMRRRTGGKLSTDVLSVNLTRIAGTRRFLRSRATII
jgi:hypothetical protein